MPIQDKGGSLTDEEIIDEYWGRDQAAIDHTDAKYGKYVYRICFNILRQDQNSEECRNDTYFKIWNSIPPTKPANFKAFLTKLARAVSIDRFRREHAKKNSSAGLAECLDDCAGFLKDDFSVSDELEARELAAILNRFLSGLSERERVCFVKRYYFACTVPELVRETGIPRSTVYFILDSVKEKLKKTLIEEDYFQ